MKATCWPFSIASSAASTATIVLPGSDVALQQPVHRLGLLHVFADVLQRAPLALRQMERQHAPAARRGRVSSTRVTSVFSSRSASRRRSSRPTWKRKNSSRIRRRCAGDRNALSASSGVPGGGKWASASASCRERHPQRRAHGVGQHIVEIGRKPGQRVGHEPTLHLRRDRLDPLVDRNDAAAMDRLDIVVLDDLELRVRDLQPCPLIALERAVDDQPQSRPDLILQVGGVEPGEPQRTGGIAQQGFEDPHARPPRAAQAARDHVAGRRDGLAFAQRGDRLQPPAVFVAQGKR